VAGLHLWLALSPSRRGRAPHPRTFTCAAVEPKTSHECLRFKGAPQPPARCTSMLRPRRQPQNRGFSANPGVGWCAQTRFPPWKVGCTTAGESTGLAQLSPLSPPRGCRRKYEGAPAGVRTSLAARCRQSYAVNALQFRNREAGRRGCGEAQPVIWGGTGLPEPQRWTLVRAWSSVPVTLGHGRRRYDDICTRKYVLRRQSYEDPTLAIPQRASTKSLDHRMPKWPSPKTRSPT